MIDVEELKAKAWAIANAPKKPRIGRPPSPPKHPPKRPPMSAMKFQVALRILGWSHAWTAEELRVSESSVKKWAEDWLPVPRTVELALLFCLIRERKNTAENADILARTP